jgi:NADPH-dependent 2,4-dienoyl-CoA reductase/sulfur reductase-like enzyme/rhodanese-related sulfurtransferase
MNTKLIIIGGVAGGATAAARARRVDENAEIILFERGEHISFANCGLPYYIGEVIKKRDNLFVTTTKAFSKRYRVDVRVFSEVKAIDRKNKRVEILDGRTGQNYQESYDKIILSPGAAPLKPPLQGIDLDRIYHLRNIPDSDRIKEYVDLHRPKSAVIIGGGFIGLEMAENLRHRGLKVTVLELLDQVMAPLDFEMAAIVQTHLEEHGIICDLGNGVKSFSENENGLDVHTNKGYGIECEMVILSIGVTPENHLAKESGLKIGERGGIKVDATMRTSDTHIYAVGDAVEVRDLVTGLPIMTPLAGPANKQGRIAADNALGRKSIFRGTQGTAIVKVCDLTIATTGASEKRLTQNQIPCLCSYTHSNSHASYYPDASTLSIKLVFSPVDGQILGSQIIGRDGVDKRIDVMATAVRANMTVYDLEELELAYAPPYSSAKDPVNMAGFVAANILKGDLDTLLWNGIDDLDPEWFQLIDLRNQDELDKEGFIKGGLHIPLDDLRDRLDQFDPGKTYIPYCAVGYRGYLAHRILVQNGFRCLNLSGGIKTYKDARNEVIK